MNRNMNYHTRSISEQHPVSQLNNALPVAQPESFIREHSDSQQSLEQLFNPTQATGKPLRSRNLPASFFKQSLREDECATGTGQATPISNNLHSRSVSFDQRSGPLVGRPNFHLRTQSTLAPMPRLVSNDSSHQSYSSQSIESPQSYSTEDLNNVGWSPSGTAPQTFVQQSQQVALNPASAVLVNSHPSQNTVIHHHQIHNQFDSSNQQQQQPHIGQSFHSQQPQQHANLHSRVNSQPILRSEHIAPIQPVADQANHLHHHQNSHHSTDDINNNNVGWSSGGPAAQQSTRQQSFVQQAQQALPAPAPSVLVHSHPSQHTVIHHHQIHNHTQFEPSNQQQQQQQHIGPPFHSHQPQQSTTTQSRLHGHSLHHHEHVPIQQVEEQSAHFHIVNHNPQVHDHPHHNHNSQLHSQNHVHHHGHHHHTYHQPPPLPPQQVFYNT